MIALQDGSGPIPFHDMQHRTRALGGARGMNSGLGELDDLDDLDGLDGGWMLGINGGRYHAARSSQFVAAATMLVSLAVGIAPREAPNARCLLT